MGALPAFSWEEPADAPLKRTSLYDTHVALGGRMVPFGGYEMPMRYETSVGEEHTAVREAAGLFDATHIGRVRCQWHTRHRISQHRAHQRRIRPQNWPIPLHLPAACPMALSLTICWFIVWQQIASCSL